MPDTKISGMTNGGAVVATDNIPAVRAGANVRVQVAAVAGSGAYADLSGRPILGSAAAQDTSAFATAAQGTLAGTAVQPGAITGSGLTQATARLLGRSTAGTGAVEEITLGTNLSFTGTTLNAAGGGGAPGGSDTQVQFNDGGAFAGASGWTWNKTTNTMTLASGSQTTSNPAQTVTQNWNAAAVAFTGWLLNINDAASAAASTLLRLQTNSANRFSFRKDSTLFGESNAYIQLQNSPGSSFGVIGGSSVFAGSNLALQTFGQLQVIAGSGQVIFQTEAANIFAQRNGVSAQETRLYERYTSDTDRSYLSMRAVAANAFIIETVAQTQTRKNLTIGAPQVAIDGLLVPRAYTTATRPAFANGAVIFDSDLDKLLIGGASAWEVVTSA